MKTSNRIFILFLLLLPVFALQAQVPAAPSRYVVYFKDKNNSPYSINNPQQFLSQRALDRRTRYNIAIDVHDLPVNPQYVSGVQGVGVVILNKSKWLNCVTIWTPDTSVLSEISALPYVRSIASVARRKANDKNPVKDFSRGKAPKDRFASTAKSGNSTIDYGLGSNQITMFNGQVLHQLGFMGQGMQIAVLDAGFQGADVHDAFDSLFINNQILGTRDFVNPGNSDVYQFNTHGTYVLSCMGGNLPGQLVGTAPKASYWLLRTEEGASENIIEEFNWSSGAEYADSAGADVINSSLGYTVFDDTLANHTFADLDGDKTPITRAADFAASRGMLVVNSAGNSGTSNWLRIGAPADADSILTVGAVDSTRAYVEFSSKGPSADGRVKPNVCARGRSAWVANLAGGIMPGSGTSFSSPIIAGAVTCFWQAHQESNNMQIIDAVQRSSSQYSNPDSLMGYGIPDFATAAQFLPTGVANLATDKDEILNIFPNPFFGTFNIVYRPEKSKVIDVTVTDMAGKKVFGKNYPVKPGEANTIVLSGLENTPKGQYVVTVKSGKQRISKTLMKE